MGKQWRSVCEGNGKGNGGGGKTVISERARSLLLSGSLWSKGGWRWLWEERLVSRERKGLGWWEEERLWEGDGGWRRGATKEEENPKQGGCGCSFCFCQVGAAGWFERDGFLGLGFFVFPSNVKNYPPFCMCWKLLFIGKNVARSPNLIPQLLLFFL